MSSYLFLSHGPDDAGYVDRLVEYLAAAGVPVWIGQHVDYGDQSVIHAQIDGSAGVIMVMSPSAQASTWVARELNWAESSDIPVFPLLLSGEAFLRLADRDYIDVSTGAMPPPPFVARLRNRLAEAQLEVEARARAAATNTVTLAALGVRLPREPDQAQRTVAGARSLPVAAAAAATVLILLAVAVVVWLASPSGDAVAGPDTTASTGGRASLTKAPGSSPDHPPESASPGQTNSSGRPTAHTTSGVGGQTTAGSPLTTGITTTALEPTVTSIHLNMPSSVPAEGSVDASVTISTVMPTDTIIMISSDNATVAEPTESTVTVPAGTLTSNHISVLGHVEGQATISIALAGTPGASIDFTVGPLP